VKELSRRGRLQEGVDIRGCVNGSICQAQWCFGVVFGVVFDDEFLIHGDISSFCVS
jgi:hypothetical protein